jgi:hypothetical protein
LGDLLREYSEVSAGIAATSQLFILQEKSLGITAKENISNTIADKFGRMAIVLENGLKPQTVDTAKSGGDNIRNIYTQSIYKAFGLDFLLAPTIDAVKFNLFISTSLHPLITYIIEKLNYHYSLNLAFDLQDLTMKPQPIY